jgi:hypothetical protein
VRKRTAVLALGATLILGVGATAKGQEAPSAADCVSIKRVYSEKHWRQKDPSHGVRVCHAANRAGARRTVQHFRLYQRLSVRLRPYRCPGGLPGGALVADPLLRSIACESQLQLFLGADIRAGAKWIRTSCCQSWGAPAPVRTFQAQGVRVHEIAASRCHSEQLERLQKLLGMTTGERAGVPIDAPASGPQPV